MATRTMTAHIAHAQWRGSLEKGEGTLQTHSGTLQTGYSFNKRFAGEKGATPEELIGAAHAGCYNMALSKVLGEAGFEPAEVNTRATVNLEKVQDGFEITSIQLDVTAQIDGIEEEQFLRLVNQAKEECVVSRALSAPRIEAEGRLA